jgi:hypothetical protein
LTDILTIASDHPSVAIMRQAISDLGSTDETRMLDTIVRAGCADCGLDREAYEVLAFGRAYRAHVVLLRRLEDGSLGLLRTPSDEEDADMDPNEHSTYEQASTSDRSLIPDAMRPSNHEWDMPTMERLVHDAVAVERSREDAMAAVRRRLSPAIEALRDRSRDVDDTDMKAVVDDALARLDKGLSA